MDSSVYGPTADTKESILFPAALDLCRSPLMVKKLVFDFEEECGESGF